MPQRKSRSKSSPKRAAKPEPAPKRGRGRPPGAGAFTPTEQQRAMVKMMAAYRVPQDEMALAIINPNNSQPISETLLKQKFAAELKLGYLEGRNRIMAATFKSATEGNVTAQIWPQKVLYGFHEKMRVDLPGDPEKEGGGVARDPEEMDELERARRVAFVLAMGANMSKRREEA